jgi:hypothetical protein
MELTRYLMLIQGKTLPSVHFESEPHLTLTPSLPITRSML